MTKLAIAMKAHVWMIAAALWLIAVGAGTWVMLDYSEAAGVAAKAPAQWPKASSVVPAGDRPTLLMFVHPHCPCSRASLGELDRLIARGNGRFRTHVLFVRPEGVDEDWVNSALFEKAAALTDVKVAVDEGGREAALFNVVTSGQTLLYDRQGALLFEGGLTPARGHAGDSAGRAAVLGLLEQQLAGKYETPVFGCELCETGGAQ
ncbi:MAG TPA: hypothetical protein VD994_15950 [Prosthecobacter sp.]|nr:hypothetical protein [Prosthecobacter sp.]